MPSLEKNLQISKIILMKNYYFPYKYPIVSIFDFQTPVKIWVCSNIFF